MPDAAYSQATALQTFKTSEWQKSKKEMVL